MRYKQPMSLVKRNYLQKKLDVKSWLYYLNKIRRYGIRNTYKSIKLNHQNKHFKYELGVVAIIKNEAPYLREWIEFHRLVGVEVFYLFDNESTDNTKEVLEQYISQGIVKYTFAKGTGQQIPIYNKTFSFCRNDVRWLAIIDADEFLVPINHKTILEMLDSVGGSFSQLLVGWLIYGSNGYKSKPNGLVIENFKYHADLDFMADYKPIINPRLAVNMTFPHWVNVIGKTVDENGRRIWGYPFITKTYALPSSKNKIRINHYYSKSLEEFLTKSKRGYADYVGSDRSIRDMDAFKEHDQNSVTDNVMDKYIDELKVRENIE